MLICVHHIVCHFSVVKCATLAQGKTYRNSEHKNSFGVFISSFRHSYSFNIFSSFLSTHADYVQSIDVCAVVAIVVKCQLQVSYLFTDPIDGCSVDRCILRRTPLVARGTWWMYTVHCLWRKQIDCAKTVPTAFGYCLWNTRRRRSWTGLAKSCCCRRWTYTSEFWVTLRNQFFEFSFLFR